MPKALIIAEKPSVAADIARALGGFTKHDEYFESEQYVLSSAVGHLLEIAAPEEYEVKRGKWSFAHLPVIPPRFDLLPIAKSATRLKLLSKLIKRKDINTLINACDAGREGELIFRYIAQHAKAKQTVQRLWLQSMTPQAIQDGFARLRSDSEMQPLADAARCRSEADWLVGINGTRAMTAFNSKGGGFFLTTVGRVQTPTLSVVVEREEKIRRFVPRDYWEVKAEFVSAAGFYEGRWFDPKFKKNEFDPEQRDSRLWSEAAADSIVAACRARYNEATLLSAMEGAGKLVEDDELRAAMETKGLGTPATRAAIIEGLLTEKYLIREGRELLPTAKAFQLMTLLRGLNVKELTAAELTGEWESKLTQMEHGQLTRDTFMREIAQMTQLIVKRAKEYDSDTIPGDYATLSTPCPHCGNQPAI
ncbi:hypothetical protein BGZ97_004062 [Linnemannia gamsii]|uniref:DNA topoisomerase n=1 Tax=Linnemannia gamsii TaxID=64522 RepID=A0A9P6UX31_9FUNG|nr:hypothetical protein BGZ97_004062 [Linnemannia gamsii]